ncbi:hypothetical protein BDA96_04G273500 [Sorghum bicolor]|uniref:Uncharacterized protein n=1 Tax=Sorghum bicolor TaxID=4558 RepID=A0A921R8U0_SORBI|nr:hypothetical protein BDA96_04G273500 [Sorghum bicolor]
MVMAMLFPWLAWRLVSSLSARSSILPRAVCPRSPGLRPRPLPLIGSLHLATPLMSLRLGAVTTVVISSPDVARELLQKQDAVFANRFVPHAVGDHTPTTPCPGCPHSAHAGAPSERSWQLRARAVRAAPRRLDALQHLRRQKVWRNSWATSGRWRCREARWTPAAWRVRHVPESCLPRHDILPCDLTNLYDHTGSKGFHEVVTEIMEVAASPNLSDLFPTLAWADLQGYRRRLAKLFARLHQVFDVEIDRRLCERDAGDPPEERLPRPVA